ncbi:hypothetical protein B0T21DRAFT_343856 [Apiosordaria backusii]|uniref:Uncharacterized protein n=1 Tax=Apiosordaria backusii TaxID=314023 RepID=A0AA40EZE7_9PEZI|nr:hypothetical protein B0T21DRAFT_343856 [Apiosordaria backusii]
MCFGMEGQRSPPVSFRLVLAEEDTNLVCNVPLGDSFELIEMLRRTGESWRYIEGMYIRYFERQCARPKTQQQKPAWPPTFGTVSHVDTTIMHELAISNAHQLQPGSKVGIQRASSPVRQHDAGPAVSLAAQHSVYGSLGAGGQSHIVTRWCWPKLQLSSRCNPWQLSSINIQQRQVLSSILMPLGRVSFLMTDASGAVNTPHRPFITTWRRAHHATNCRACACVERVGSQLSCLQAHVSGGCLRNRRRTPRTCQNPTDSYSQPGHLDIGAPHLDILVQAAREERSALDPQKSNVSGPLFSKNSTGCNYIVCW